MRYEKAYDVEMLAREIIDRLGFDWIKLDRLGFVRSYGSRSKNIIARCHSIGKVWQKALGIRPSYAIEVIAERYDRLSEEEKTKTIIHELLHIPKSFGGGFRHHDYVCEKRVDKLYRELVRKRRNIL